MKVRTCPGASRSGWSFHRLIAFPIIRQLLPDFRSSQKNEIAGVNWKSGPPFKAMNSWLSSWKVADMTVPLGPGPRPHGE
jgi:hypothetical protein